MKISFIKTILVWVEIRKLVNDKPRLLTYQANAGTYCAKCVDPEPAP